MSSTNTQYNNISSSFSVLGKLDLEGYFGNNRATLLSGKGMVIESDGNTPICSFESPQSAIKYASSRMDLLKDSALAVVASEGSYTLVEMQAKSGTPLTEKNLTHQKSVNVDGNLELNKDIVAVVTQVSSDSPVPKILFYDNCDIGGGQAAFVMSYNEFMLRGQDADTFEKNKEKYRSRTCEPGFKVLDSLPEPKQIGVKIRR